MPKLIDQLKAALAGRYEIDREAGVGGMARVYRARDLRHDRPVAIKVLEPDLAKIVGAERFLREIRVTANLQHPHILPLFDSGEADGLLYYVMPFVEGESLRERIAREGRLPVADAVRIFTEIADGLGAAHAQGVIHRDIKPANVLLAGRHAVVADFGVARALTEASGSDRLTRIGVAVGTPRYMAPEQAAADDATDHRADLFAAGVIAYEMLTGISPFEGDTPRTTLAALMTRVPEPLGELRDDLSPELCRVVERCLEKDPSDRWQSAPELLDALETLDTPVAGTPAVATPIPAGARPIWRRPVWGVAVAAGIALALLIGVGEDQAAWATNEGIPEVERLLDAGDWDAAHRMVGRVASVAPDHPALEELRSTVSVRRTIRTTPEGATVHRREYGVPDAEREEIGTTPLVDVLVPRGASVFSFERAGYETVDIVSTGGDLTIPMDPVGAVPEGMVRVPGLELEREEGAVDLASFFLGRYEVTNAEYKEFVDAGGYARAEYWKHPFVDGNLELGWEEAVARFTDRTGRTGPSTWEIGTYPEGMEDHPVGGLSWYEAAAYARFRGAALPTVHHWRRAFQQSHVAYLVPHSNLESTGTTPVHDADGLGRFGTYDMAGNVREWCYNGTDGLRFIMGGGWNDPNYVANGPYAQSPFDRTETNGVRLARYVDSDEALDLARHPVPREPVPDFDGFEPVSDEVFAVYLRMFEYDRTPLEAAITAADTARYWIRERITFDAAYGGERMVAYLYLPRDAEPPFQAVLYYPGSGMLNTRRIDDMTPLNFDFVIRSGRAVVLPAYNGTLDRPSNVAEESRQLGLPYASTPRPTISYRDHVVQWGKDIGRTIDYLGTRPDIDAGKLAFYGVSWGGRMGSIMLAVEPRFQAAVLNIAGFNASVPAPEVYAPNYAPRVSDPVLMLSGRFDHVFPLETHTLPMFRKLGTPAEHKRHFISEGGHFVPRTDLIRETLGWLDRYLGPIQ